MFLTVLEKPISVSAKGTEERQSELDQRLCLLLRRRGLPERSQMRRLRMGMSKRDEREASRL